MAGRREMGRNRATRALIALVAALACLSGVAYAASRSEQDRPRTEQSAHPGRKQGQPPPRPRLVQVPPRVAVGSGWRFRFRARASLGKARFQCRLDGGEWRACSSPRLLGHLPPGNHSFAVRALNRHGLPGRPARYRWSQAEPKQLTIEPLTGSLDELMPGAPPQQLPVRIGNPNPVPIEVTGLTVSVTPEASACSGDSNFAVTPAGLSAAAPLAVPAGGSVELPTAIATAPTLALRELAIDQDACQGTTVRLDFSGEARG